MMKVNIDLWILAVCMVVACLSMLMTFWIGFRKGKKAYKFEMHSGVGNNENKYEDEIAFQIACQQLDLLLVSTISDMEKQRLFLQGYLEKRENNSKPDISGEKPACDTNQFENSEEKKGRCQRHVDTYGSLPLHAEYNSISNLFHSGMSTAQISDSLSIPKSEVELFVKLHLKEHRVQKKSMPQITLSA